MRLVAYELRRSLLLATALLAVEACVADPPKIEVRGAGQCCVCRDGAQFPQGVGCETACASNGSTYSGNTKQCLNSQPPPIANSAEPGSCRESRTIGGDCKGNNWCRSCMGLRPYAVAFREGDVFFYPTKAGANLLFTGGSPVFAWQEHGEGWSRTVLGLTGYIVWGDGTASGFQSVIPLQTSHCYEKPGNYLVMWRQVGDFKWHNDHEGSCSYQCTSGPPAELHIRVTPGDPGAKCDKTIETAFTEDTSVR